MQLPDPISSQGWADKILWMLGGGGVVGGLVALANLILNRNKPKADIAKTAADTEETRANTTVKLSGQILTLHDRMNFLEASIDTHQQETATTIRFYREQIEVLERKVEYNDKLDLAYRNRSHALNGELGRLVLAITNLQVEYLEKTGEKAEAFEIRTYDQIIAGFPLPLAPQ